MCAGSSRPASATTTTASASTSGRYVGPLGMVPGFAAHGASTSASSASTAAASSTAAGSPRSTWPAGIPLGRW
eukprot:6582633-Alexandrium_andersonii.AAC.1